MGTEIGNGAGDPRDRTREKLARHLAGDDAASEELFQVHRKYLISKARIRLRRTVLSQVMNEEDLVDEVFLRALESGFFRRFRAENSGALRVALGKMMSRTIVDLYRQRSSQKRHPARLPAPYPDETPTSHVRATELLELCQRELTPKEWNVWRSATVEGLTSTEIASQTGTTDAAVRGVLLRSRQRILGALAGRMSEST